jgi:hypothetical protein
MVNLLRHETKIRIEKMRILPHIRSMNMVKRNWKVCNRALTMPLVVAGGLLLAGCETIRDSVQDAHSFLLANPPPPQYGVLPNGEICAFGGPSAGTVDRRALERGGPVTVRPYNDPNASRGQVYINPRYRSC